MYIYYYYYIIQRISKNVAAYSKLKEWMSSLSGDEQESIYTLEELDSIKVEEESSEITYSD